MLILSRKIGQRLVITEQIEITIVRIRGGSVTLGVLAPDHISVDRLEVRRRMEAGPSGSTAAVETD